MLDITFAMYWLSPSLAKEIVQGITRYQPGLTSNMAIIKRNNSLG